LNSDLVCSRLDDARDHAKPGLASPHQQFMVPMEAAPWWLGGVLMMHSFGRSIWLELWQEHAERAKTD